MIKFISGIVLISCLVFVSPLLYAAGPLTEWEHGIFIEVVEQWHEYLYTMSGGPGENERNYTYQQVASKYNISVNEVTRIEDKAVNIAPNKQDYEIYEELGRRLDAMPQGGTVEQARRIHLEIANQYGISLVQLHEIEYVMEVGYWD
jgi:hypothetical protein